MIDVQGYVTLKVTQEWSWDLNPGIPATYFPSPAPPCVVSCVEGLSQAKDLNPHKSQAV